MRAVDHRSATALQPHPLPALGNIERDLVLNADRLAFAALLIVRPIGSTRVVLGLRGRDSVYCRFALPRARRPRELLLNLSPVVEDVLVVA